MSRNTHALAVPGNAQITYRRYSGLRKESPQVHKRKGACRGMRRRALLSLMSMALFLVLVRGTALAEEAQLDQEWETHDTTVGINQYGGFQTSRAGVTGTLGKVAILVGCCAGTDAPAGDLRVAVTSGNASSTATIPKGTFTNDDVLRWEDVTLDTSIPLQGGSTPSDVKISLRNTSATSPYLWALDAKSSGGTSGGYVRGQFWGCYVEFRDRIECDPSSADAIFRTYVTPGPDLVPPQTDIPFAEGGFHNGPSEGSTSPSSRVIFKFHAFENDYAAGSGITFECKMDGSNWETCTSPKEYNGLSEGSHTFQVRAIDPYGNVDPTPASRQWFIDTTPPDTTITSHPSEQSDDSTPTFEFTSNEATSASYGPFQCKYQFFPSLGSWISCDSPLTIGVIPTSGSYTFEVRAVDQFNRSDPSPASYTWTYTETAAPPSPSITSPQNNSYDTDGSLSVSGSAEAASTVELFDGTTSKGTIKADSSSGVWSIALSGVSEGAHTYTAKATDASGNTSSASNSVTVTVDTAPPETNIISGPSGPSKDNTPTFTFSGSDNLSQAANLRYSYKVDGSAWSAYSSETSITLGGASGLSEGPHTFYTKAQDEAGNEDQSPAQRNIMVDITKPTVTATTPLNRTTNVARGTDLTATFSEKMMTSINGKTFKLFKVNADGTQTQITDVVVSLSSDGLKATLNTFGTKTTLLARNTKYKGVLTTGSKEVAGNSLAQQKSWTFTTKP